MTTAAFRRAAIPGTINEKYALLAGLAATLIFATVHFLLHPNVPLYLLYLFPIAFVSFHARTKFTVLLIAGSSFLVQLWILHFYEVSRTEFIADIVMIFVACATTIIAVRARVFIDVADRRAADEKLNASESNYKAFFENVAIGAAQIDRAGHILDANIRFCEMTGYARDELVGKLTIFDLAKLQYSHAIQAGVSDVFEGTTRSVHAAHRLVGKNGTALWIDVTASPVREGDGQVRKIAVLVADVTQRREAELSLQSSEASLRAFFDNAAAGAIQLDENGFFIRANSSYCEIVGYSREELLEKLTPNDIDAPEFRETHLESLRRLLNGLDSQYIIEEQIVRKDGTLRWVRIAASKLEQAGSGRRGSAAVIIDITPEKRAEARLLESRDELQVMNASLEVEVQRRTASLMEANRKLVSLARMDALTGIPNRLAANERLREEYALMKRKMQSYALLMIDIDHFKLVNDTHGHEMGDRVLQRIASSLRNELRESDFIARFGGEEFLAVLPATTLEGGLVVASKIRHAIGNLDIHGLGRLTISIGVSVAFPDDESKDIAVNDADVALYKAKTTGRNKVVACPTARVDVDAAGG